MVSYDVITACVAASPQVVQAPLTPTPEVEDQIKRLETDKSEALRLGDYK